MKIALIHDWLRVNAGSEKVVKQILHTFHKHDIEVYTLFNKLNPIDQAEILNNKHCNTSWINYLPAINSYYKNLLPFYPLLIEHLNVPKSDLYISSSHAVAKGVKLPTGSIHICYCHTPMRYAWFLYDDYLKYHKGFKLFLFKLLIPFIRKWDLKSSRNVTHFIANSRHIQVQIKKVYGRDSTVIYPPVQIDKFLLNANKRQNYYLALGRFVPYKQIEIIIKAFLKMPLLKLVFIGDGKPSKELRKLLKDAVNIVWLGYQHEDELLLYMQNAKACIFAAKEDFGIMCVEAQSTGTPILALNYGGYKETIVEGKTGYFFETQEVDSIQEAVKKFEEFPLEDHSTISEHAKQFSTERFKKEIQLFINEKMNAS